MSDAPRDIGTSIATGNASRRAHLRGHASASVACTQQTGARHSERSASTGSTLDARRAGNHVAAMASLEAAKNQIVNGTSVMFFPEGTRSRDGKLKRFKKGAFRMAIDLELPILPLTVTGTRDVLPADTSDLLPGSARLIIHPPISVEGLTAEDCSRLSQQVREVIASALPSDQV